MTELRTFTEWLRLVESPNPWFEKMVEDSEFRFNQNMIFRSLGLLEVNKEHISEMQKVLNLHRLYGNNLELATPEEKSLLKKYGYQLDPVFKFEPIIKFQD